MAWLVTPGLGRGATTLKAVLLTATALWGWGLTTVPAHASSATVCEADTQPNAAVQDRLLQVAALVKALLVQSGQRLALVSRSGLALQRVGQRYSHAGVSLQESPHTTWSVRQLYFACDESRPRIFDQGMSGFVLGVNDADEGYLSIVLLPDSAAAPLERAVLDDGAALQLLGATYSANAYAFSQRYQNCNQWLAEMLATAWGSLGVQANPRTAAQQWLTAQNYQPTVFRLGWTPLVWLATRSRWLHRDDHPDSDLQAAQFRVSMPQSIVGFVRQRYPESTHIELCYTATRVVVRHGWEPIATGCVPGTQDTVVALATAALAASGAP